MNEVIVVGGRKKEREIAEKTVVWCMKKLMPRMRTLDIQVEFEKIDACGYCMKEDDKGREFTLTINKNMTLFELVGTICHEMVHVKQYARKELHEDRNGNTMWKTKNHNNTSYQDAPWEKEAYKLERGLTIECLENLDFLV